MADHYIYESPVKECLCQGDVLNRTPELIDLLSKIHPHYATHPYSYFVVVTQTCDLVCRDGCPPSSPYITIAATKPAEEVIIREAKKHQAWWEEPLYLLDSKEYDQMVLFIESLLNNNVPNYFYLHEDLSLKISGHHCAVLALAITLKAENYEICRTAKVAQIKEVFRAKLGWLIGNMYSRVGTPDWDDHYGKHDSRREASQLLKNIFSRIDKEKKERAVKELTEAGGALKSYSPDDIFCKINSISNASNQKRFSDRMNELFNENIKLIQPVCSRLTQDITKDIDFADAIKKALLENKDEIETTVKEITKVLSNHLRSYLSEDTFPGRENLKRKIIETIRQDSIIKHTLT